MLSASRKTLPSAASTPRRLKRDPGHASAEHALRFLSPGQLDVSEVEEGHPIERLAPPSHIEELGNRRTRLANTQTRERIFERHEPAGVPIRQWPQPHRIQQGEDRHVGADTERQHPDDGAGREAIAAERSRGVSNLLQQRIQPAHAIPSEFHLDVGRGL